MIQGQFSGIVCIQKTLGWPCITIHSSWQRLLGSLDPNFAISQLKTISVQVRILNSLILKRRVHQTTSSDLFFLYERTCSFHGLLPTVLNLWLPDERSSISDPHGKILQVLKSQITGWHKCNLPCTAEQISQAKVAILKVAQTAAFALERSVLLAKRIASENICVGTLNWVLQKRSL